MRKIPRAFASNKSKNIRVVVVVDRLEQQMIDLVLMRRKVADAERQAAPEVCELPDLRLMH